MDTPGGKKGPNLTRKAARGTGTILVPDEREQEVVSLQAKKRQGKPSREPREKKRSLALFFSKEIAGGRREGVHGKKL